MIKQQIKRIVEWFKALSFRKKLASIIILIIIPILVNIISHKINKWLDSEENIELESQQNTLTKANFELSNYYIKVQNTTYPNLDTLLLKYSGVKSKDLILKDIELIKSELENDINLYSGPGASPYTISLIDSYKSNDSIFLELRRKMIFDGFRAAWFEEEDKHKIGTLTFTIPYMSGNKILKDTLINKIYLVK
jgi:hypothetical protein